MAATGTRRRWLRWTAGGIVVFVILLVAAALIGLGRLPGGLAQVGFGRILTAGELTYAVPHEFLEAQIAGGFPRSYRLTPTAEFVFTDPHLQGDTDAKFLRLDVDFEARLGTGQPPQSGRATLRGQLRFDRAAGTVALTAVQLASVRMAGKDGLANLLLPGLFESMVAPAIEGTVVYRLPAANDFWRQTGVGLVRDVRVEDGHVTIAVGP